MARFGVSVFIVFTGAYALGQTGLPWRMMVVMLEWLSTNGYLAMEGPLAALVLTAV